MQLVGALQFYFDPQGRLYALDPTTGKTYLVAQGSSAPVEEAPLDGQRYTRQSAAWTALEPAGAWQECTYPPGCSGPLYARLLGNPQMGMGIIEVVGEASSVSMWDASYSFILAHLPSGLAPSGDRFALVPSSHTSSTPDSISCAWFKPTGEIAIAFIYEKGQNPLIAWFDTVSIQI